MSRLIAALALIAPLPALAHAPVIVEGDLSESAPFLIDDPEHSKALYGQLDGAPDYYRWTADEVFDFYVGITAPRVEGCPIAATFSAEVTDEAGNSWPCLTVKAANGGPGSRNSESGGIG